MKHLYTDSRHLEAVQAKNLTAEWLTERLSTATGPLVFGSLVLPNPYHRDSISRLATHFLRQVYQRCRAKKKGWKPDLKRVVFVEGKEGESEHLHFIMEVPSTMTVEDFCRLCETRWISIATRDLYASKPYLELPKDQATIVYPTRYAHLAKVQPVMEDIHGHGGLSGVVRYCLKWTPLSQNERRPDFHSHMLLESRNQYTKNGHSVQFVLL